MPVDHRINAPSIIDRKLSKVDRKREISLTGVKGAYLIGAKPSDSFVKCGIDDDAVNVLRENVRGRERARTEHRDYAMHRTRIYRHSNKNRNNTVLSM